MHRRRGGAHPAVAFVFHQTQRAGFRDREIDPADADFAGKELFAQHLSGDGVQFLDDLGVRCIGDFFVKQLGDLIAVFVDGGNDDVRGRFVFQLDDVFAEIGFQRLDAAFVQEMVEVHFLRHHRLALDDAGGVVALDDLQEDRVSVRRSFGPMHLNPVFGAFLFQPLQQFRQLAQRSLADGVAARAQLLEKFRIGKQRAAAQPQGVHGRPQIAAQLPVAQRLFEILGKIDRDLSHWVRSSKNSATCLAGIGLLRCFSAPPICIRQP